ncbi:hypothetical protein ABZP36_006982 [Zizania latifolia]
MAPAQLFSPFPSRQRPQAYQVSRSNERGRCVVCGVAVSGLVDVRIRNSTCFSSGRKRFDMAKNLSASVPVGKIEEGNNKRPSCSVTEQTAVGEGEPPEVGVALLLEAPLLGIE